MYPENLSVCRAKSIKWQIPDLAKSGTAKWTKKAHASSKQAKHQQNRRGPTNKAHMEASQEEGGHTAAKGGGVGRPDPLVGRPDRKAPRPLGAKPRRWEVEGTPFPLFFLAPSPLSTSINRRVPPLTLRHTPRSSLSHSSLILSLGSSSELGVEAESVPDLLSGSSV